MSAVIAGAAGGFLMASVFTCAGIFIAFSLVKNPPPRIQPLLKKFPPGSLMLSVVFFSYPAWGIIGAVIGVVYNVVGDEAPGPGLGSPNLAFTLAVIVVGLMLTAPVAVLLRRFIAGVLAMFLAFIGVFGWFLPYFAA